MNKKHVEILNSGVENWNRWREENPHIIPNLENADLRKACLRRADLWEANLRGTNLWEANLHKADLRRADLRGADLLEADLRKACLRRADLRRANMLGADLRRADLRGSDLRGADPRGADLWEANLRGTNLDFSCLPLCCGSAGIVLDTRQKKQIMAHALNLAQDEFPGGLTQEQKDWLNEFHRIKSGEFPKF